MDMDKEQIREAMRQAAANLAIEGLKTTEEEDELIELRLSGMISHEEFIRRALELAKRG